MKPLRSGQVSEVTVYIKVFDTKHLRSGQVFEVTVYIKGIWHETPEIRRGIWSYCNNIKVFDTKHLRSGQVSEVITVWM